MNSPPAVFLIDDVDEFSNSFVTLVSSIGLETEVYSSGASFLQHHDFTRAGCAVIDLGKPHLEGMQVLFELFQRDPPLPAVVLTTRADVPSVVQATQLGVTAFLQKTQAGRTEILDAIQAAIKQDVHQRAVLARRQEIQSRFAKLTDNERQVLDLLLQGHELIAIAQQLNISRRTVETRRAALMKKLQVTTFPSLVAIAVEQNVTSPS